MSTDEVVPFAGSARLPTPSELKDLLRAELNAHVSVHRDARGEVHQPEDTWALVRKLANAHDVFGEYAEAFATAAKVAKRELDEELMVAVGDNDGVPLAGMKVPDLDDTDLHFTLDKANTHDIETQPVIAAVIAHIIATMAGGEPVQADDEDDQAYDARYWSWFAHVMERAIDVVLSLGSYTMQVSKVRAFAAALGSEGQDGMSAVVTGSIHTTPRYRGVKMERRRRRKP